MSSAMAAEFAARAKEMTERIGTLGPSPLRIPGNMPKKGEREGEA